MYWSVIKANLKDISWEDKFNRWYNTSHMLLYVSHPGFRRGWRLKRLNHEYQKGELGQMLLAVYDIISIDSFVTALQMNEEIGDNFWKEWEQRVTDRQRNFYRVRFAYRDHEKEDTSVAGRFWTIVRVDFEGRDPQKEIQFNNWYDKVHVPEVCSFLNFRRAWRLEAIPHDHQLGPMGQKYWAIYETEDIDYLPKVRGGKIPWDGIWSRYIKNWSITFYQLLYQDLSGSAW